MRVIKTPNISRGTNQMLCIVLHSTEGSFNGAISWLTNPKSKASCHYVVSKKGEVVKLASDSDITWHAGKSKWINPKTKKVYTNINNISIGIEQEHFDLKDEWPNIQISTVAKLCADLMSLHPSIVEITKHRIISPKRKIDPADYPDKLFNEYLDNFKENWNKPLPLNLVKLIINNRYFKIPCWLEKNKVVAKNLDLQGIKKVNLPLDNIISVADFFKNYIDKTATIKYNSVQKKLYIYSKEIK